MIVNDGFYKKKRRRRRSKMARKSVKNCPRDRAGLPEDTSKEDV